MTAPIDFGVGEVKKGAWSYFISTPINFRFGGGERGAYLYLMSVPIILELAQVKGAPIFILWLHLLLLICNR